jgi:hypothetical protein
MEMTTRRVDWLAIDLLTLQDRKDQARRALSIEERTKRSLAKGEALLAQARLATRT